MAAAHNQNIRTNLVKVNIGESQIDTLCRLQKKVDKSIDNVVSG